MAKFCTNCGKKLKQGEVCDCQQNSTSKLDVKEYFNNFVELVKGMFQRPIETMKDNYKKGDFIFSNILIVAGSIILGLFIMLLLKETVGSLFGFISLTSMDFDFPYFRVFLTVTFVTLVTYYLVTLILQLFIKYVCKKKVEYKYILNIIATITIYITLASLISIILVFISLYLVYALLLVVGILIIICLTFALKEIIGLDEMKVIYTIVATLLIIIFINWLVMPRLFM